MSRGHLAQKKKLENNLAKELEEVEKKLMNVEELMKKYEVGELVTEDFRAIVIIDLRTTDLKEHFTVDHS